MSNALSKPDQPGQPVAQTAAQRQAARRQQLQQGGKQNDAERRMEEAQAAARAMSSQQRAAVIIALLGPENAGPIIEQIEDRHLKAFYESYEGLARIPREVLLATVAEFVSELKNLDGTLKGGAVEAKELSARLFDSERAKRIFGTDINARPKADIWLRVAREKASDLARYFETKRPQVIALVLSQLPNELAGEVLAELSDEKTQEVVRRLSRPVKIDENTQQVLGDVMEAEYFAEDNASEGKKDNPLATVSSILSVLPGNKRDAILDFLASKEPSEAERIRQTMLTFENLPTRISRTAVPVVFRQMDTDKLLKALKLAKVNAPDTLEFFYANISKRMVEQYQEQVEELGPIKKKEAESAQASMMSLIARLEKDGEIELVRQEPEGGDEDDEEKI